MSIINKNDALRLGGILASSVALYHGIKGESFLKSLSIQPPASRAILRGSFHIGTMGWLTGGILLYIAADLRGSAGRNAIATAYAILYGVPAVCATFIIHREIKMPLVILMAVSGLAIYGRNED